MPPVLRKFKTLNSLPVEEETVEINPHQGTSINQLPFDCFHLIFRGFDLRTQILNLRTVCRTWHAHIEAICAQTSHITLKPYYKPLKSNQRKIITEDWFSPRDLKQHVKNRTESNDFEFRLARITKLTTSSLINRTSLFVPFATNLTELTLYFNHHWNSVNINIGNVEKLFKSFSTFTSLRTFTLKIEHGALSLDSSRNNNQLIRSLYELIGDCVTYEKLPTLTSLHLNIDLMKWDQEFLNLGLEIHLDPHLLAQLEHFSIDFHTRRVPGLLGQLNPGLTFLSFNCDLLPPYSVNHHDKWAEKQLNRALLGEPLFGPYLSHLRLCKVWHLPLELFFDRFTALQSVQLGTNYNGDPFDEKLIKPLNQLAQLVELRLHGYRVRVFPVLTLLGHESQCLPRVKKLIWCNRGLLCDFAWKRRAERQFDGDLFCRTVAKQFQNLEELEMLNRGNEHAHQVRDGLHHFKKLKITFFDFDV